MKLWGGRFEGETDGDVEVFTTSILEDQALWSADIRGSIAHARMLGRQGIIPVTDAARLIEGLQGLHADLSAGKLAIDHTAEDVHSFVEVELGRRVGDVARKLHAARSRNDQVATDLRLFVADELTSLRQAIHDLQGEILRQAEGETETLMPGTTHLQHGQPVSLAHHLMATFWMLARDVERINEIRKRTLTLPLGAAALAGTGFPIDRESVAQDLGFTAICENSLDAVSDRDFVVESLSMGSLVMMHLSRLSEELVMWSTPAYGFVELGDSVTTGSSIMPQKKNPDVAELIRGRVGRLYGALMGALTMMKALPLAYNRDMQEDKKHLIDSLSVARESVKMTKLMLSSATWRRERMATALKGDFSNATDLADDLVVKGLSFREAHEVIGKLVRKCLAQGKGLEDLTLAELQSEHALFDQTSLAKIPHGAVMRARTSRGGTAPVAVREQITKAKNLWKSQGVAAVKTQDQAADSST